MANDMFVSENQETPAKGKKANDEKKELSPEEKVKTLNERAAKLQLAADKVKQKAQALENNEAIALGKMLMDDDKQKELVAKYRAAIKAKENKKT